MIATTKVVKTKTAAITTTTTTTLTTTTTTTLTTTTATSSHLNDLKLIFRCCPVEGRFVVFVFGQKTRFAFE